jgi:hypothetical protein
MSSLSLLCDFSLGREPPCTYYEVLDISPDEHDLQIIENAALRCSVRARVYQLTSEAECTLRLKEIAEALITLLDPVLRQEYDLVLGKPLRAAQSERRPPGRRGPAVLLRGKSAPVTWGEDTLVHLIGKCGTCDVRLVYRGSSR